jgi:hypothetical protein
LCAFHVIGRDRLALRSNAGFFADLPASIVLFNLALNLKGVAERKKTVFFPTYFLQSSIINYVEYVILLTVKVCGLVKKTGTL